MYEQKIQTCVIEPNKALFVLYLLLRKILKIRIA